MTWTQIASVNQLNEDEGLPFTVGDKQLAVFRSAGQFFATDNVCTHQFALLTDGYVEDGCVECPLHQAMFDLATGEAKCAPATQAIKIYPVKVEDGFIYVNAE